MDMDSSTVADWRVLSCKKILAKQNDLFPLKFIYKMAIKRILEISGFQITCEINMYQIEYAVLSIHELWNDNDIIRIEGIGA